MTLRPIPNVHYIINHSEDSEISDIFKKAVLSLNLALHKTFKGTKYKKFAILFYVNNNNTESVFEIICPEIEFVTNFQKFVEEDYSVGEVQQTFESMKEIFSEIIDKIPFEKYIAETIVYDEQAGRITLGEETLDMGVATTSGLLFFLDSLFRGKWIIDPDGLIVDNYNLRKLIIYQYDNGKVDFSRVKINSDNYEEWDYYYPEYDREEKVNRIKYAAKIKKELSNELLEFKEIKLPKNEDAFLEIIEEIITDFKQMVEDTGYKLLLNENGMPRDEESCQLFFGIYLKKYCQSQGIDLTREVQTGRGPIDFRFSSTVNFIAHVEIKKENNPKLAHGLSKQLPTYMNSEEVSIGFFVIFDFGTKDISKLKEDLETQRIELERDKRIKLRIIYIDARPKPSASKI